MSLTISLSGDHMLGRSFNEYKRIPWDDNVIRVVRGSLWFANLETSVTASENKDPSRVFNFKIDPVLFKDLISPLRASSTLAFNIANNHILDYGLEGMEETKKVLSDLKIPFVGTVDTPYTIIPAPGMNVGFMGISDHPSEWATKGLNYLDIEGGYWTRFLEQVKMVQSKCDILIVYIHWGPNWVDTINPKYVEFAHSLIDNGVTIVAGTSPHHLLPMEFYKDGIIFYSLGDFIDDYAVDEKHRSDLGILSQVVFSDKKIEKVLLWPSRIDKMKVSLLGRDDPDYNTVTKMMGITPL